MNFLTTTLLLRAYLFTFVVFVTVTIYVQNGFSVGSYSIAGSSSIFFKCTWNKSGSWAALLKSWFRTDLGRQNSTGFYMQGRQSHCHALITLYVQFLCSNWSKFDRWVHAENLSASGNLLTDSWSWQSFVSSCDVLNCLFLLGVQNEIQLLSRLFCNSLLVCLLRILLTNARLVKVIGNPISDGIVFKNEFTHLPLLEA